MTYEQAMDKLSAIGRKNDATITALQERVRELEGARRSRQASRRARPIRGEGKCF